MKDELIKNAKTKEIEVLDMKFGFFDALVAARMNDLGELKRRTRK